MIDRAHALRAGLDTVLRQHPPALDAARDPVIFPRRRLAAGAERTDIESVALLAAMLAYGGVDLFMPVVDRILAGCPPPYPAGFTRPRRGFAWPGYRLSRPEELRRFAAAIAGVRDRYGGLWEAFAPGWSRGGNAWDGLAALRGALCQAAGGEAARLPRGLRHLLPDPLGGSCAKRWMLFLRWMARPDDGVDLGLWPDLPPAALIVPLDRHIARFARRFGWTRRRTSDRRAAEEITAALRRLDPADPLRYDFALCHLGIEGRCPATPSVARCAACPLAAACADAGPRRGRPPEEPEAAR